MYHWREWNCLSLYLVTKQVSSMDNRSVYWVLSFPLKWHTSPLANYIAACQRWSFLPLKGKILLMNKSISVMYDPMQCSINLSSRNLNKTACICFKNTNCCFIIHYFLVCLMLIFNLAVRYAFFIEKFKSWWRSCFRNTNCCLLHYTMLSTVVPCF